MRRAQLHPHSLEMPWVPHRCPLCARLGWQVIYYGLPARVCSSEACSCLWAHWSIEWLLTLLPFNGWLFRYENCYWRALWQWLKDGL